MNQRSARLLGSVASVLSVMMVSTGCSTRTKGPSEFTVAPGGYQAAFDATRELLLDMDFELERVDATAGIISTAPHYSQGLLEPWDHTQSGLGDEWADAMNTQARTVRVAFTQAGAPPLDPEAQTEGAIWVTLYRNNRSGRRLDAEWVGGSTFSFDPLQQKRHTSSYLVPTRRDEALEARLVARLADVPGLSPAAPGAEAGPEALQRPEPPGSTPAEPAPRRPRSPW